MAKVHMKHTPECLKIIQALDRVRWCPGNGSCMQTHCSHKKMREDKLVAHRVCEQKYWERLRELAFLTAGDGKSKSSGEKDEIQLFG